MGWSTAATCGRAEWRRRSSNGWRRALPLLELRDVGARYGETRALHGITLSVEDGDFVAILGANGAGKTTTLRAISGTREVDGRADPRGQQDLSSHTGGDGSARRRARAGRSRHVRDSFGARQPASRRVDETRHVAAGSRARVRVLPAALRTACAARRKSLGRRAADARTGSRDDGEAAAAPARRAVARARTADPCARSSTRCG